MTESTGAAADILAAAAELFAERGYKATTTRAIAERAGVNEVTVFRRFGSKRGILEAIGERWSTKLAGFAAASLDPALPVRDALTQLATAEVAQTLEEGALAMRLAMDAAISPDVAEWISAGSSANFAGLRDYLAGKQRTGEVRPDIDASVLAETFFAFTSNLVLGRAIVGADVSADRVPIEDAVGQALEVYFRGIEPR